jgi:hypothetical protein
VTAGRLPLSLWLVANVLLVVDVVVRRYVLDAGGQLSITD